MKKIVIMKMDRIKPRLQFDVIQTLRHRGGAHGDRSGKKTYNRQDKSWLKENS